MRWPAHSVVLGPTMVLAAYGTAHASPHSLIRPLIIAVLLGLFLMGIGRVVIRTWERGAVVATLVLLLVGGLIPAFAAVVIAAAFLLARQRLWHVDGGWQRLTLLLNAIVTTWFAIATVTAIAVSIPPAGFEFHRITVSRGPNVYLILLDAYPRHDTLEEYFGFNNAPFLNALEDRGFDVAENSKGNYTGTMPTVAAVLTTMPAEDLLGAEWEGSNEQYRRLWQFMNASPVVEGYEAAGYETYAIASSAASLDLRSADTLLVSGMPNRFEDHLLGLGILQLINTAPLDRAELLDGFRHLRESAGTTPRFVFAHMMTPHDPYVFKADGSPAAPCGEACRNHAGTPNPLLADRFLGQLEWTNDQVLAAIDQIVDVDPEAVIVVWSDHGLRRDPDDPAEWHRTFFAARNADFPEDITPVEILPTLVDS